MCFPLHLCISLLAHSHLSLPMTLWIFWCRKQTGPTLLPVSLMWAMSAGENHILPEMIVLENLVTGPGYSFWTQWWWFSSSNQTVPPYQTATYYLPSGWQLLCTSPHCTSRTLLVWMYLHLLLQYGRYCPGVKNMSIVHVSADTAHRDQTTFHPRTTYLYWQKSAV